MFSKKKVILIILLLIIVLVALLVGYWFWNKEQHRINMTFNGKLILPDGRTEALTVEVEGSFYNDDYSLRFTASENHYFQFAKLDRERVFDLDEGLPYNIVITILYDKNAPGKSIAGYCALSAKEGLLLIYTNWHGPEKGYQDELGYIFYGSVNGDYTLEEMQEYFTIFHRDYG